VLNMSLIVSYIQLLKQIVYYSMFYKKDFYTTVNYTECLECQLSPVSLIDELQFELEPVIFGNHEPGLELVHISNKLSRYWIVNTRLYE